MQSTHRNLMKIWGIVNGSDSFRCDLSDEILLRFHRCVLCNPVRFSGRCPETRGVVGGWGGVGGSPLDPRTDTPSLLHPFWSHVSIRFSPNLFLQRMLWIVWPKMCMWCIFVIFMACESWLITAGLRLSYYCITTYMLSCDAWYSHVIYY